MDYKKEKLNELISDLLSVIYNKGCEASRYAENAGRHGRYHEALANDLTKYGLNCYEARNFLSVIGFSLLPSINAVCKEKEIETSRPYLEALYYYKEDIARYLNERIDNMAVGYREYLEEIADKAVYFKHIYSGKGND